MRYNLTDSNSRDPSIVDALELHLNTYHSALKSSGEIRINALQETHDNSKPILHLKAGTDKIDLPALIYTSLRLPDCINKVETVVLGQSPEVFEKGGYPKIENWRRVSSPGRKRTSYFNRKDTLACFITSISDIDDLVNSLIAFQEEWNKFHDKLKTKPLKDLAKEFEPESWEKIKIVWGKYYKKRINNIKKTKLDFSIRLLAGSWIDYTKATQRWWKNISATLKPKLRLSHQTIYFVSSNTHSLINLASGYTLAKEKEIANFLQKHFSPLFAQYQEIKNGVSSFPLNDFIYYAARKYYQFYPEKLKHKENYEKKLGMRTISAIHYLDVQAQVIPIKILAGGQVDSRLVIKDPKKISKSNCYILNIDYPLGFSAYHVLAEIMENMNAIKGIYVIGKAATLNGKIGDLLIPKVIYDEHSQNSYLLKNCFNNSLKHILSSGSILDNQKGVSVFGTFLQNQSLINRYIQEGITIIEMENGPYLNAIAEAAYPNRYPTNEIVSHDRLPFDLGIINYASDTPYSKTKNMGIRNLSLEGVEPTYFASLSILQRIINLESLS